MNSQTDHGLFIAFDIGLATSGVSYCLNAHAKEPLQLCSVNQFPGQDDIPECTRMPSILLYNPFGQLCAAGAEVKDHEDLIEDDYDDWSKVQLFKLHLSPHSSDVGQPELPEKITPIIAYSDMLSYLTKCARDHILRVHPALATEWTSILADRTEFIISHPNGWDGLQQWKLRQAMIKAGLVPDDLEGHARVNFVADGESLMHFCARAEPSLLTESAAIVMDLGAATLDINAYRRFTTTLEYAHFEEAAIPVCSPEGSTAILSRLKALLERRLKNSPYGTPSKVAHMVEVFNEITVLRFRSSGDVCSIPFGIRSDNDYASNVRNGEFRLSGVDVASFFEPTISACVDAIRSMTGSSNEQIKVIYIVGGLRSSTYLISTLRNRLQDLDLTFYFPDTQSVNPIAEGALSSLLEHRVSSRISPITFGTHCELVYNPRNPEHIKRTRQHDVKRSGSVYVRGAFAPIVRRGYPVSEDTEYRHNFHREFDHPSQISDLTWFVINYEGDNEPPRWLDDVTTPGIFKDYFKVTADLSPIRSAIRPTRHTDSSRFYKVELSVVLTYCGSEKRARVMWKDYGSSYEQRIPAHISYEDIY